jgi:hypothetical protein
MKTTKHRINKKSSTTILDEDIADKNATNNSYDSSTPVNKDINIDFIDRGKH